MLPVLKCKIESPRLIYDSARKANEKMEALAAVKEAKVEVSKISDDEESKSQNPAIPSEILRSAMKLSFIFAAK